MRVPLLVSAVLLLGGCQAVSGSPHLIEVGELAPRQLGPGERLELHGRGFPEGRRARITFHGQLARAGQATEHDVEISAFADTVSPRTLALEFDRRLEREFCGAESPQHTTFRGSVQAAFAPRSAAAPPVTGELFEVTLDVVPQASLEQIEARSREGERYAEFLGVLLEPESRGLRVKGVLPKSRAESAGIGAGDVLAELDGVRVFGFEDLVPAASARRSRLMVRRLQASDPVALAVDSAGFRPKSAKELVPALAIVALAAVLALLLRSPLGRLFTWLERRIVQRVRKPTSLTSARPGGAFDGALAAIAAELPSGAGPYFAIVLVAAAFSAIALGRELCAAELDLPILVCAALSAQVVAGLIDGGRPRLAFGQRLRVLFGVMLQQVTLVLAAGSAVLDARSTRAFDLVAAQGALPWTYGGFVSPLALCAFVLFVLALLPRAQRQAELSVARSSAPIVACAEWAASMVYCCIGALVFLGGYRVPWVSLASASIALSALSALLLCIKALGLLGLVLALRAVFGRVDAAQAWPVTMRWLLPGALLLLGLRVLWLRFGEATGLSAAASALGFACFGAVCVLAALLVARVGLELRRNQYEPSISPWL